MDHAGVAFHQQFQVVIADLRHVLGLKTRLLTLLDSLFDFERGLVHVHLDHGVQLIGDDPDLFQVVVTDGIRCMRAKSDFDARVMGEVVEQLYAVMQGFVRGAGARNREVQHGHGNLRAHTAGMDTFGRDLGVEIHVRETGDTALELFGNRQIGAVMHEIFIDPFAFGRPDMVLQPGHQRQVVGQAAKQGHRRVTVGVAQPGLHGILPQRLGPWTDIDDATVANADTVVLEYHACGGRSKRSSGGMAFGMRRFPELITLMTKYTRASSRTARYNQPLLMLSFGCSRWSWRCAIDCWLRRK